MKQASTLTMAIAFVCFLLSCKKESLPDLTSSLDSANARMNEEKVPFSASYITRLQTLAGPPILHHRVTGTGKATHLGNSTFLANAFVNLTTAPPFSVQGTSVFTAANGDEFYTAYTGTSSPNGDGTTTAVLNNNITGGTGRFDNASGSFVGRTVANPIQPTGFITYEGNISY